MNRAMRRMNARQAAMRGRPAAPQLIPMTDIAMWNRRPDGSVETHRRAEFWRRLPGPDRRVACSLCYRRCEIADGEAGWCTFRRNAGGRLAIPEHGVTSMGWPDPIGYTGGGPWFLYRAGARFLSLGGIRCTARCSFCSSAEIVWDPDRLPWVGGAPGMPGTAGGWSAARAILHPAAALQAAREWACDGVLFGINEPTLDFEFTYDVARVMKRAGLRAIMNTNGFTTPEAIAQLAPVMDAVLVGVKGSGDPAFYDRWMKSPGAMAAVKAALRAWQQSGVYLTVGDLVAAPHMQTEAVAASAQRQFYGWVVETLGPLTPLLLYGIHRPKEPHRPLVPGTLDEVNERIERAAEVAREAGLQYVRTWATDYDGIWCHNCGGLLLRKTEMTPEGNCAAHEQYVTDGRCDHCGVAVPIVTISDVEAARTPTGQRRP